MLPKDDNTKSLLRWTFLTFAAVFVAVAVFVHINIQIAVIGHVGGGLVAATFLLTPALVARWRNEYLEDYGFRWDPVLRGLAFGIAIPMLVVFPLFCIGYLGFHELACAPDSALESLLLPGTCRSFPGWDQPDFAALAGGNIRHVIDVIATEVIAVALPEELFFRGLLLYWLERAIPPKRRFLGGGIGWALIISSALFALIHLPRYGGPHGLATFFPALMFGWMRSATGSILGCTLAHASSNLLIKLLTKIY